MKINQKIISIIGVISILGLLLARGPIMNWEKDDSYNFHFIPQTTKFTSINVEINQTQKKLDSLIYKKNKIINEDNVFLGWSIDHIGIGKLQKKGVDFPDTTVYLQLGNIGVDINEKIGKSFLMYYEKKGQGYLSRTKLLRDVTTEANNKGKLISSKGNKVVFIDKKVDYKYDYGEKSMIVPLRSKLEEVLATVMVCAFGILQVLLGFIILGLFLRYLMFIAKNMAFEEGNVQRLKYISFLFFILAVNKYILYGIVYLIFISSYSSDGVGINYSFWENDYLAMIFAILSYLIYTAFKRGMLLQQENELTI